MPTFRLYKDGKKVQGQFYLFYNLFFSKDKNLGSSNTRQRVVDVIDIFCKILVLNICRYLKGFYTCKKTSDIKIITFAWLVHHIASE